MKSQPVHHFPDGGSGNIISVAQLTQLTKIIQIPDLVRGRFTVDHERLPFSQPV
jgi:hypothetical protein